MTENVLIFGDSFADPEFGNSLTPHTKWFDALSEKYNVYNYARYGTGPDWSVTQLIDNFKPDSHIVFLMSNTSRLDWKFLRDPSHSHLMLDKVPAFSMLDTKYLHNHVKDFRSFFLNYIDSPNWTYEYYKWVSLLKSFEPMCKSILVWDLFGDSCHYARTKQQEQIFVKMLKTFNTDKFELITYPLAKISQENCEEVDFSFKDKQDKQRYNHLGAKLHNTMYKSLDAWFRNGKHIDIKKFIKFNNGQSYPFDPFFT